MLANVLFMLLKTFFSVLHFFNAANYSEESDDFSFDSTSLAFNILNNSKPVFLSSPKHLHLSSKQSTPSNVTKHFPLHSFGGQTNVHFIMFLPFAKYLLISFPSSVDNTSMMLVKAGAIDEHSHSLRLLMSFNAVTPKSFYGLSTAAT
jgi:hypothetical protein